MTFQLSANITTIASILWVKDINRSMVNGNDYDCCFENTLTIPARHPVAVAQLLSLQVAGQIEP
jgi:hypothetical protein